MRIIAGEKKGAVLLTLPGETTRPTLERVKEAMFSTIQFVLPGASVLDLFAGSGQMGLEALSRGASRCVFVDNDRQAFDVVKKNVRHLKLEEKSEVLLSDAGFYLLNTKEKFDIVFLDPPFTSQQLPEILQKVSEITAESGVVFCETSSDTVFFEKIGSLNLVKRYKYGKINVVRYKNK